MADVLPSFEFLNRKIEPIWILYIILKKKPGKAFCRLFGDEKVFNRYLATSNKLWIESTEWLNNAAVDDAKRRRLWRREKWQLLIWLLDENNYRML